MKLNDPVSAPVLGRRPMHMTWKDLLRVFHGGRTVEWLMRSEGITWIRGHVEEDSPEWRALLVARELGDTSGPPG
ncbi:MAG TPA: hypothetical protein VGY48_15790 [Vicinamibacterales bacterium]|jgi:hypothetical protein|nr:hypothetical protein [Vicinamibacterales bacterium]